MTSTAGTGFCFPYTIRDVPGMGRGVFTDVDIPVGTLVWRFLPGRYTVHDERSFMELIKDMSKEQVVYELTHAFGFADFPDCVICFRDDGTLINHSNTANIATNFDVAPGAVLDPTAPAYLADVTKALLSPRYGLIAVRDITAGEQFTNNYNDDLTDAPFYERLYELYDVEDAYLE